MSEVQEMIDELNELAGLMESFGVCLCEVGPANWKCPDCQRAEELRAEADRLSGAAA